MYFDIICVSEPDENGNLVDKFQRVTVAPEYPEITPKDMSTENQLRAGAQLTQVGLLNKGDKLNKSDQAHRDLKNYGDQIEVVSDPTPSDPTPSDPTPSDPTPSNE